MTSVDVDLLDRLPVDEPIGAGHCTPRVVVPIPKDHALWGGISPDHILAVDLNAEPLKGLEYVVGIGLAPTDLHESTGYPLMRHHTQALTMSTCTPKTGWLSGDVYCSVHGRNSGWPCKAAG